MAASSSLQIEVVSTGIAETVRKLDSLGNAAARNEAKVKLLTDSLGKLMTAQATAVSFAAQQSAAMNAVASAMGMMANSATTTANQITFLNSQLGTLNNTSNSTTAAFQRKSGAATIVNATLRAMATAAAAYLGLNFAKGIIEAADGWKMMQARLKLATGSMEEARQVQGNLYDMAQRLRIPLEDAAKLYTRMAIPMQRMGKDAQQTAEQVEFVSLALKLNGATAAEASSVMLQYSQSVNAGRLNGAEFNAVAEGAPGILRAIEAELKATGKWSEFSGKTLKKMGSDGEITFELMNRAAQRALPEMRKAFEELPLTVDGAIQRLKNAWFKAMGEMGETTDIGTKLAKAIATLEADIPKIRDALASTFLFLYDNFSRIALVVEAIVVGKFIQWVAGAALAIPALVTGLIAATTAVGAASGALGVMKIALTALTGPWGILISLVGTAAVAAWQYFGKEVPKADALVTESTRIQTVDRLKLIQKEIDKINERNSVATGKVPEAYKVTDNDKEQVALITKINGLKSAQQSVSDEAIKGAYQVSINMLDTKLKTIQGQQTVLNGLKKITEDNLNADKVSGLRKELKLKTETKPEQADREVKEMEEKFKALGAVMSDKEKLALRMDILGDKLGAKSEKRDPYKELRSSIAATTSELEINIAAGEKATAAERLRATLDVGKNVDYKNMSSVQKATIDAMVAQNIALEQQISLRDRVNKANTDASQEEDKHTKKLSAGVSTINEEILKTREQTLALTESKTAAKDLAGVELERKAVIAEAMAIKQLDRNGDMVQYDLYMAQAKALRELTGAQHKLGVAKDVNAAKAELDKLLDPKRAMNFGEALKEAFGDVGGAIGDMSKALGIYSKDQEKIDEKRKMFMSLDDSKDRTKGLAALDKKEEQSKLRMYGAMAGGAKEFFSEHTTAHKLLAGAEKAIRIAELAGTMANFAMKSGLLTAFTGLFVTAKTTEVVVDSTATATMLGAHVAAGAADVAITGTTESAKNALKVPGVFMSFMNWLGPWGMAAAGVAIAAVLGGAFGGSGPTFDLKDRQAKQGTGTVLGDDEAKSESLTNAMSALEDNSNIGLVLTSNMLTALRGIQASMQGLASAVFRASGMTTGKNFGITEGTTGGGIISSIFGGKTTTTILDTGLALNGTASDFKRGDGVQQYVDVNKQTSGGLFSKGKSSNERTFMEATDEITTTIGRVFQEINNTISSASLSLEPYAANIKSVMDAYVIQTEVSFKGLKGAELSEALNNVFSASADGIARTVFPGLQAFQKAGEGYYETLIRVSTGSEQARNALQGFGIMMVGRDSLVNKTGDIAAEIVRQSIMASNAGTTMSEIMKVMSGSMSDLVEGYKSLLNIQDTMRGANLGQQVSRNTIRGAGGIPELQSALGDFVDGFYSDAERQVIGLSKLRAEFDRLNVVMPESKEGFKSLVTSMMAGNAESQELAGRLLLLSGGTADFFSVVEDSLKSLKESTQDLGVSLLRAQGNTSGADAAQRLIDIKTYGKAEIAAYDYNAALTKQIEVATSLKSLSEESTDLQISLMRVQGDAVGADAAQRLISIKTYGKAEIAAYDYNAALKKQTEILVQRASLESELLKLQNDTVALRNLERKSIEASNLGLFDKITAINLAKTATTEAFDTLKLSVAAEKTRIGLIKDIASESVTNIKSVFELLKSNISDLYGTVSGTRVMQAGQGSDFITNALKTLLSTGYLPDAKELTEAITAARGGLNAEQFATQFEADQAALVMAGELSQLQIVSGEQLTTAEQALLVANDQLKALDDSLAFYQRQIDALNGVNTSVLSIGAAITNLASAIAMQKMAMTPVVAPVAPARQTYSASEIQTAASDIVGKYQTSNGIDWNGADAAVGRAAIAAGVSSSQLAASLGVSQSYILQRASDLGLPSFAIGTNYVPSDMVAQIHEGEAIVPKAYNPAAGNGRNNSNNNEQLEKLVECLTTEVKRLQSLVAEGNINTGRTAVAVNGNPDRPVLVEIAT